MATMDIYTKAQTDAKLANKQDTLTFDTVPTENSTNPVTSGGVYDAINSGGGGSQKETWGIKMADGTTAVKMVDAESVDVPSSLYGCGDNLEGQQGDGTTTDVTTFTQRLANETIASVVAPRNATWALTTDGKLYGCGNREFGQQGDGYSSSSTPIKSLTQRLDTETIASVSASESSTWALTTDGKLYGCGDNEYGQQSYGMTTSTPVTSFTQRLTNETIASVAASNQTTWAVTTDGKLYGCGSNSFGQQGAGGASQVAAFVRRLSGETIASVAASSKTTWALTTDGKLYGCGSNDDGQQGAGTTTDVTTFTQRLTGETIASIAASNFTTWVLTTDGKLYGCGDNQYGQQGSGNTTDVTTFTQRLANETIASVFASERTTWALTTDGKLYGCGQNYGNQGDGTTTNVTTFTQRLTGEAIASVYASDQTTWVLTTDGKFYGCGYNTNGQQGSGDTTRVTSFTQRLTGETIASVAASKETTWVIAVSSLPLDVKLISKDAVDHETWTFTLEDNSTVTKEVVIWTGARSRE